MIIIRFQGALGNQICQYAMYKKLKKLYPEQDVKVDLTIFSHDIENPYRMDIAFGKIPMEKATRREIYKVSHQLPLVGLEKFCTGRKISDKVLRKITYWLNNGIKQINGHLKKKISLEEFTIFQDYSDYDTLDERIFHLSSEKDWYIHGTWYNYNFDDVKKEVLEVLKFPSIKNDDDKNFRIMNEIKSCNSVSIHIRRGNYVTKGYLLLGDSYYKSAVDYMLEHVKNPHFFVFSDEIEIAKEMFREYDKKMFTFVEGNEDPRSFLDMHLMSICKNNIIANSTFSLCSTFLNTNKNIVIVPKLWTAGGIPTWKNSEWIYLE